jgi:hypothetical protein
LARVDRQNRSVERFQARFSLPRYHPGMATRVRTPAPPIVAAVGSALLALASLALAARPTYDPYAWLIWGRQITHLDLVTTGSGASWKPLPALVDALLAPLGGAAPAGWLVVARAGALFAVFMAFWLAWRLAGPGRRALAGIVAAASLALTHEWLRRNGVGDAEGLMTALGLLALDRHLDGRRGQAFGLLVAGGLIRVEMWPFVVAYGAWLWFASDRPRRELLVAGGLLIPLLWFGGDWLGSGSLTASAGRALERTPGTAGPGPHPALGVAREAYHMLPLPAWIGAAAALVLGIARKRTVLVIAGGAAAWTALVAVMAENGYAGLPRFLFMASALEAVLAGVGAAAIADAVAAAISRARLPRPRAVAVAAVVGGFALAAAPDVAQLRTDAASVEWVADTDGQLTTAIHKVGGARAIFHCGRPAIPWFMVTALAWHLGVDVSRVDERPSGSRSVVFVPHPDRWTVRRDCRGGVSPATQPAPPR